MKLLHSTTVQYHNNWNPSLFDSTIFKTYYYKMLRNPFNQHTDPKRYSLSSLKTLSRPKGDSTYD